MTLPTEIQSDISKLIEGKSDDDVIQALKKYLDEKYDSEATRVVRYSQVKKWLKPQVSQAVYDAIKPPSDVTERIIEKNKETRDAGKVKTITNDVIEKLFGFANSDDPFQLFMYILFVSGRRTTEVLQGDFKSAKGRGKVEFDGLLKTRGDTPPKAIIEIIGDKTTFLKAVRRCRKKVKASGHTFDTFKRYLDRRIKKEFGPGFRAHTLRGIYANYMYEFNNPQKKKINTFIKDVLNHNSIDSSLSYTQYKLEGVQPLTKRKKSTPPPSE